MKVLNLEMKDFRNHESNFMIFDKINVFVGKNNAGKSSINAAIRAALVGDSEWTNKKSTSGLVRHGQNEASVEVELNELGLLKRIIKAKGGNDVYLNGGKLPDAEVIKELKTDLNIDYDILACVLDSYKFMNMKPDDQKDFLFAVTGARLDAQKIIDCMENPSQRAKDEVVKVIGNQIILNIEVLDKIYKDFSASRKAEKSKLSATKMELENIQKVDDNGADLVKIKEEIEKLQKEREKLITAVALIDEKNKNKEKFTKYLEAANKNIQALEKELPKNVSISDMEEKIFDLVTEINQLESDLREKKTAYKIYQDQTTGLESVLNKLSTPICPLSDKLVCKTDKTAIENDLKKQLENNKKEILCLKEDSDKIIKILEDKKKETDILRKQINLMADYDRYIGEKKAFEEEIKKIKVESKTDLEKNIKQVEDLIAKQEVVKTEKEAFVKYKAKLEVLTKQYAEQVENVAFFEYMVKEFSPKGVKTKVLESIMAPVEKHCNEVLKRLTNDAYSITIDLSNGFEILIQNKSGVVEYNYLSKSEKLRIGFVIQDAINKLTNADVLIIDDIETLDADNMNLFFDLLNKIKDEYDSIFISFTVNDTNSPVINQLKGLKDTKIFEVKDGKVS